MFDNSFSFEPFESKGNDFETNTNTNILACFGSGDQVVQDIGFGQENSFSAEPKSKNNCTKNIKKNINDYDKSKVEHFLTILKNIYSEQKQKNEEIVYNERNELEMTSYCQTSYKLENSLLILCSIIEKNNFQKLKRSLNQIRRFSRNTLKDINNSEDSSNSGIFKNQSNKVSNIDLDDCITYNVIEESLSKSCLLIENQFLQKKEFALDRILQLGLHKEYQEDLLKIQEAERKQEQQLTEERNNIKELENVTLKLERKLNQAGDERNDLLAEAKREENILENIKVKDRSLENILIDKELTKYERENREQKLKLEKKRKRSKKIHDRDEQDIASL